MGEILGQVGVLLVHPNHLLRQQVIAHLVNGKRQELAERIGEIEGGFIHLIQRQQIFQEKRLLRRVVQLIGHFGFVKGVHFFIDCCNCPLANRWESGQAVVEADDRFDGQVVQFQHFKQDGAIFGREPTQ